MQLVALRTRNAATLNPVTCLMEGMRTLILDGGGWGRVAVAFAVGAVLCAVVMVLDVRSIRHYD